MKKILVLIILALPVLVNGQFNFKPGRVITNKNDTLTGLIHDGGIRNMKICIYRSSKKDKIQKFYPQDIKSYIIFGKKYYSSQLVTKKGEKSISFIEVLLEGKVSLYYNPKSNNRAYLIRKENEKVKVLSRETIELKHKNKVANSYWQNESYTVRFNSYKDTLGQIFGDCALIRGQIPDCEYEHEPLVNLTKTYIGLTYPVENNIIYEQPKQRIDINFGLFAGMQYATAHFTGSNYEEALESDYDYSMRLGTFLNVPLNFLSDKISVQVEVVMSKLEYSPMLKKISNETAYTVIGSDVVSIPIFFKYDFGYSKLKPTVGVGNEIGILYNSRFQYLEYNPNEDEDLYYAGVNYSMHRKQRGGWFLDLGLKYEVNPKISFFCSARYQERYSLIIEHDNSYYSYKETLEEGNGIEFQNNITSFHVGLNF